MKKSCVARLAQPSCRRKAVDDLDRVFMRNSEVTLLRLHIVTTGHLRRTQADLQALTLAASAHGIERLLLRVMLPSIRLEVDDCCLTQQPFYLHASKDTVSQGLCDTCAYFGAT